MVGNLTLNDFTILLFNWFNCVRVRNECLQVCDGFEKELDGRL